MVDLLAMLYAMGVFGLILAGPVLILGWTGPIHPPRIEADGLVWRVRHVRAGIAWGCAGELLLGSLLSLPVVLVLAIVLALGESYGVALLLLLLPLLGLTSVPAWLAYFYPRIEGELRASADGLVWKRPIGTRSWAWRELYTVQMIDGELHLETVEGERIRVPMPGAEPDDLASVCEVLEATHQAPPPPAEEAPEMPDELRDLQRRTARKGEANGSRG